MWKGDAEERESGLDSVSRVGKALAAAGRSGSGVADSVVKESLREVRAGLCYEQSSENINPHMTHYVSLAWSSW